MSKRAGLLAAAAVLVAAVMISLVIWRSGGPSSLKPPSAGTAEEFEFDGATLVSPGIEIVLVKVRGTVLPGYTDWAFLFECREPEGCNADLMLAVDYRSSGRPEKLYITGRVNAAEGEIMRIGRPLRPPTAVDGIDKVVVEMLRSYRDAGPEPTEME